MNGFNRLRLAVTSGETPKVSQGSPSQTLFGCFIPDYYEGPFQ